MDWNIAAVCTVCRGPNILCQLELFRKGGLLDSRLSAANSGMPRSKFRLPRLVESKFTNAVVSSLTIFHVRPGE